MECVESLEHNIQNMRVLKTMVTNVKKNNVEKKRSFLKWAGGKYQIVDRINAVLPKGKRLIEPFVGSGTVFLNTDFERYVLADTNLDLINLLKVLKREKESFIEYCATFFNPANNQKSAFLKHRVMFNTTKDLRLKAALFLYLNRHAFNGLIRYNSSGQYNVAFGDYKRPYFPEEEMLQFAKKLTRATIKQADFLQTLKRVKKGDVVYCDPPYVPLSETANFTQYAQNGFGQEEQEALASMAKALSKQGIPVVLSNHDTRFVRKVYHGAKFSSFSVQRSISCQGKTRGRAKELLAVFT